MVGANGAQRRALVRPDPVPWLLVFLVLVIEEAMVMIHSAYIVQTRILGLGEVPFDAGRDRNMRRIFRPIFKSTSCFTDMRLSIQDRWRPSIPLLPDKPFLRDLGPLVFDTRSARLARRYHRSYLAWLLARGRNYWDPEARPTDLSYLVRETEIFGYDHSLKDQRMNHLYFELRQPLFVQAISDGDVVADGKVFIHIYPSGFLAIHLAIALTQPRLADWVSIRRGLVESRPWRDDNRWAWRTRLGSGKLMEVMQRVSESLYQSLRRDVSRFSVRAPWHTALKLVTDYAPEQVADNLLLDHCRTLELGTYTPTDRQTGQRTGPTYAKYLISSDQGIAAVFNPGWGRKSLLRTFWKVHALYEFVLLKNRIYDDYITYLRSEVVKLKEYRLSAMRKLRREDIRHFSVFDPRISRYLLALDNHIKKASPYFRRVYSFLSEETGFDSRRETLLGLVEEWEDEVAQWEHSAAILWKKLLSPLKELLGKTLLGIG